MFGLAQLISCRGWAAFLSRGYVRPRARRQSGRGGDQFPRDARKCESRPMKSQGKHSWENETISYNRILAVVEFKPKSGLEVRLLVGFERIVEQLSLVDMLLELLTLQPSLDAL